MSHGFILNHTISGFWNKKTVLLAKQYIFINMQKKQYCLLPVKQYNKKKGGKK